VFVVADPDWDLPPGGEDDDAIHLSQRASPPRPVVWEGPIEDESDDEEVARTDSTVPRPVWQLHGSIAVPVHLGGDVHALVAVDGVVFGVIRRPSDPLIKRRAPGGRVSYHYPGVVIRWEPAAGVRTIADVDDCSGQIVVDDRRVWLIGFSRGQEQVRELDTSGLGFEAPIPLQIGAPVGLSDGMLLELEEGRATRRGGPVVGCRLLRRPTSRGRALPAVDLPAVDPLAQTSDGDTWFLVSNRPELVCVNTAGVVRHVAIELDCRPYAPEATVPDGVDLPGFETDEIEGLRAALLGGALDQHGRRHPFVSGIEFTTVELRGTFPATHAVALFWAETHPGLLFGRRWNLYDDLGNPQPLDYADIGLMEDLEAAGYGLPPPEACTADHDGIVWF
jgi:hypothetical protein